MACSLNVKCLQQLGDDVSAVTNFKITLKFVFTSSESPLLNIFNTKGKGNSHLFPFKCPKGERRIHKNIGCRYLGEVFDVTRVDVYGIWLLLFLIYIILLFDLL